MFSIKMAKGGYIINAGSPMPVIATREEEVHQALAAWLEQCERARTTIAKTEVLEDNMNLGESQ